MLRGGSYLASDIDWGEETKKSFLPGTTSYPLFFIACSSANMILSVSSSRSRKLSGF